MNSKTEVQYKAAYFALRDKGLKFDRSDFYHNESAKAIHATILESYSRTCRFKPKESGGLAGKFYNALKKYADGVGLEVEYQAKN